MAVVAMAAEAAAAQLALEYTAVVRSTKRREERPQQNVVETSITPADVYTYVLSPPVAAPAAAAAVEPPPQSTPLGPPSLLLLLLLLAPAGTIKTQKHIQQSFVPGSSPRCIADPEAAAQAAPAQRKHQQQQRWQRRHGCGGGQLPFEVSG